MDSSDPANFARLVRVISTYPFIFYLHNFRKMLYGQNLLIASSLVETVEFVCFKSITFHRLFGSSSRSILTNLFQTALHFWFAHSIPSKRAAFAPIRKLQYRCKMQTNNKWQHFSRLLLGNVHYDCKSDYAKSKSITKTGRCVISYSPSENVVRF